MTSFKTSLYFLKILWFGCIFVINFKTFSTLILFIHIYCHNVWIQIVCLKSVYEFSFFEFVDLLIIVVGKFERKFDMVGYNM